MTEKLYHERQVKELCALHALNNLFQNQIFTKKELDDICDNLAPDRWVNPHRSMLGLGNYDINVILSALQTKGYDGCWFDKRKDPDALVLNNILGVIINTPYYYTIGMIMLPFNRRHWFAVCKVGKNYYNFDSKLTEPQLIGDDEAMKEFLRAELQYKNRELIIVVEREVEKTQAWLQPNT